MVRRLLLGLLLLLPLSLLDSQAADTCFGTGCSGGGSGNASGPLTETTVAGLAAIPCPGTAEVNLGRRVHISNALSATDCSTTGIIDATATCTGSGWSCSAAAVTEADPLWAASPTSVAPYMATYDCDTNKLYEWDGDVVAAGTDPIGLQTAWNAFMDKSVPGPGGYYDVYVEGTCTSASTDLFQHQRWNGTVVVQDAPLDYVAALIPTGDTVATEIQSGHPVSDNSTFSHANEGSIRTYFGAAKWSYDQDASPDDGTNDQDQPVCIFLIGDEWMSGKLDASSADSSGGWFQDDVHFDGAPLFALSDPTADALTDNRTLVDMDPDHFLINRTAGTKRTSATVVWCAFGAHRTQDENFHPKLVADPVDEDNIGLLSFNQGQGTQYVGWQINGLSNAMRVIGSGHPSFTGIYATQGLVGFQTGDGNGSNVDRATNCHATWTASPDDLCGAQLQGHVGFQMADSYFEGFSAGTFRSFGGYSAGAVVERTSFENADPKDYNHVTIGAGRCASGADVGEVCIDSSECAAAAACTCEPSNALGTKLELGPGTVVREETNTDIWGSLAIGNCAGDSNDFNGGGVIEVAATARLGYSQLGADVTPPSTDQAIFKLGTGLAALTNPPIIALHHSAMQQEAYREEWNLPSYPLYKIDGVWLRSSCDPVALAGKGDLCNDGVDLWACLPAAGNGTCDQAGEMVNLTEGSGGGGAPTGATYLTRTTDATLTAEFAMGSLATGLVFNTTTTGSPSIYTGAACTNQVIEDLSGTGAPTCVSITGAYVTDGSVPISDLVRDTGEPAPTGGEFLLADTINPTILDYKTPATVLTLIGAQPLDSDLTALAAIAGVNEDLIVRKAGAWARVGVGTEGQVFKVVGGLSAWGTDATGTGQWTTNVGPTPDVVHLTDTTFDLALGGTDGNAAIFVDVSAGSISANSFITRCTIATEACYFEAFEETASPGTAATDRVLFGWNGNQLVWTDDLGNVYKAVNDRSGIDYGDVIGSGGVVDLDEAAVRDELEGVLRLPQLQGDLTVVQIAQIATDTFLGRDTAGTGDVEVLTLTAVEAMLEPVMELQEIGGAVTDGQVPDTITLANYLALIGGTLTGNLLIDNQQELRLLEADANGSNYIGMRGLAAITANLTLTWNVTGQCSGANGGNLTINASNEVVCDADDGGAGGNIWSTIDTSEGTDPVPDTATDTLILAGGTMMDVTGDSAADSVTFAFDATEMGASTTWSAGGQSVLTWIWDVSAGDTQMTFGNDVIQYTAASVIFSGNVVLGAATASSHLLSANVVTGTDPQFAFTDNQITTLNIFSIDNQQPMRLYEGDAGGSNFVGFRAPATLGADLLLDWTITVATCTGDAQGGKLTINGSNQIVCAADSIGAGSNNWGTADAPSGTDPVADTGGDTLQFLIASGDPLTITGDSTADSLTFAFAVASEAQGDLLLRGASDWGRLADGATAGQALLAGGGGGDPAYGILDTTLTGSQLRWISAASFKAAGCQGSTAGASMSTPASGGAAAACRGTTDFRTASLDFADGSTLAAYADWTPRDVETAVAWDIVLIWARYGNEASGDVRWGLSFACKADAESLDSVTWDTESLSNVTVGTQNNRLLSTFANVAKASCAAGETLLARLRRVGGDAGDTFTGIASAHEVRVDVGRLM